MKFLASYDVQDADYSYQYEKPCAAALKNVQKYQVFTVEVPSL